MFNLYLAYSECLDMIKHLEIDSAIIFGFNSELLKKCIDTLNSTRVTIAIVPRAIHQVSEDTIDTCLKKSRYLLNGCIPSDTVSARRLAKLGTTVTIVLTPNSLKFIDESQINVMAQTPTPRYIEIHLYQFLTHLINHPNIDVEKEFYYLGTVIEKALKNDVAVIPSASSPNVRKAILVNHIDLVLYSMGFSRRERRLMLELYPMDLIQRWLKT
ncbi:MAG: hypothetical protein QW101_01865 [Ignisphaera sp.]|uniref:Uncharacterized protein n=1 Tax=Ignisphaera aggregans TaxID=334771 RepID=A0A7J3MZ44_9CREN